jgi:hypothetical protein
MYAYGDPDGGAIVPSSLLDMHLVVMGRERWQSAIGQTKEAREKLSETHITRFN